MEKVLDSIGRIEINSLNCPDNMEFVTGTYTYGGKILVSYQTIGEVSLSDYYQLATMNDDGTNFRPIFSGVIPTKVKANGIRFMPFQDNRRVLLGDYILECTPDLDACNSTQLVSVEYPSALEDDVRTTHHWSEIIIAPDNTHMSWTMLRSDVGAAVAIGALKREADRYIIENVQLISSTNYFEQDPGHPGYIVPVPLRGGEVKQFVNGGSAISVVAGGQTSSTPDSGLMDLTSDDFTQITHTPGYNETTIFSPDERLGIVMSSRFSKRTDPAIFGLMPRPYGIHTSMGIAMFLYTYAITGVRRFREGNIGPVLIEIDRSINEKGYQGISLMTDEKWVFCSPMSWHPDGRRVMWPEVLRGTTKNRLQIAKLIDYVPQPAVPFTATPVEIPYAIKDLKVFDNVHSNVEGKIAGKHSGYIVYTKHVSGYSGHTEAQYVDFSDDGERFYQGYEKIEYNAVAESRFEADLTLSGPTSGEMKFRATFGSLGGLEPAKLLFDLDEDGQPKSYGYATYDGTTLQINDLLE